LIDGKVGDIVKEPSGNNSCESVAASTLRELRELAESSDDPGEFRELIDLFLGELDSGLASMRKALAQGNGEELTKLAHSLKGASASMGAGGLALLCRTLEETAMNTDLPGAEVQLKQIEREVYIVRETLEKESSG
jgi:HPt (histidine-containing phosphotransfer) domain-containing protein